MNISILLTTLGLALAHRILGSSLEQVGFPNLHARLFSILTALMISIFIIRASHPADLWFLFGTILILLRLLPHFFSYYQEKLIQRHTIRVLDQLILGVQSGQSLRASLGSLSQQESILLRVSLENMVHAIVFEESSKNLRSPALRALFEDLKQIEKSQAKCADQLRALRRNLKIMEDFRRRSGQVSLQIRMQAGISAALFVGLLLFTVLQFGFFQYRSLILTSITLFFAGLVTVFVIGRRMRWTT